MVLHKPRKTLSPRTIPSRVSPRPRHGDPSQSGDSSNLAQHIPAVKQLEWVTICPLCKSIQSVCEDNFDDIFQFEPDDPVQADCDGGETCLCYKTLKNYPKWKWIISKQALERSKYMVEQFRKRDGEAHGVDVCNDRAGYGFQELIENTVSQIDA